ncbi:MAG: hypothetical protein ACYTGH_02375, partial [Planctomycetota bacterium]
MAEIVLDATPFLFPGAGVGRVTRSLVEAMLCQSHNHHFTLYARRLRGASAPFDHPSVHPRRLRLPKCCEPWMARLGLVERLAPGDLYHAT